MQLLTSTGAIDEEYTEVQTYLQKFGIIGALMQHDRINISAKSEMNSLHRLSLDQCKIWIRLFSTHHFHLRDHHHFNHALKSKCRSERNCIQFIHLSNDK